MMFWRSRERSVPVEKKGKIAPGSLGHSRKIISADESTHDSQMQSLNESLKIFMSERNELSSNVSTKSDMTNDTDFSVKTAIFNDTTHASTTDSDESAVCIEGNQYLEIPEGITRRPFQPLPAIFDMVKSIPTCLRTMNYYQRKVARLQPRFAHPTSPTINGLDYKLRTLTSPVAQGGNIQPNLFNTIFRGSAGVPPTSPQYRLSQSQESSVQENRSGISWADESSPSTCTKSGARNHYQNRFQPVLENNPELLSVQKQKRLTSLKQHNCAKVSTISRTPVPSAYVDQEVNLTTQYFYSPRTPFSSPLRRTTDPSLEVSERASAFSLNMKTVLTPYATFATSQPSEAFGPVSSVR